MSENISFDPFWLGSKLPTKFEIIMVLLNGGKQVRSNANSSRMNHLGKVIENLYQRVFPGNVKHPTTISRAIKKEYDKYRSTVCAHSGEKRLSAFMQYKHENQVLFDCIKSGAVLEQRQAEFLEDQATNRTKSVLEIELLWQMDGTERDLNADGEVENAEGEVENAEGGEENADEGQMDIDSVEDERVELDGMIELDEIDAEMSDDSSDPTYEPMRKRQRLDENADASKEIPLRVGPRNFNKNCIMACLKVNAQCHCSINMARKAFAIVENTFNGQDYVLEADEKHKGIPRTTEEFEKYKNVVPAEQTLLVQRHNF